MKCPRCQAQNREGVRFCEDCGTPLALPCPNCGAEIAPGKKFCGACGAALAAQAADRFPSPRAYTPKHLAERILTSRSALEGERKQVTVLFCDIVDSSRLAERLDPEAMHEVMDRALRLMAEAVHRYEGTINSGLVVVGRIGDDLRMDYTAVGDTTHLAARVQALADPGTILNSSDAGGSSSSCTTAWREPKRGGARWWESWGSRGSGSRRTPRSGLRARSPVREKAEGNPLFVEEVTTSLLERGTLVRTNGRIRWTGDAAVEVPASIQDIIRVRIDRLEEPVKRTVQTAAVIGREFGLRLLERISGIAVEVERYLDTLKHLELIHEKRFFPELEYIFKHAVTQDVAYQSLLSQRRKELHGAIGQAIEDLYADRLEEQAAILAYHYARSEHQEKAIEYALLAGDRATRLNANAEARTYYDQALSMAQTLAAGPEAERWQIDATVKLAGVALTREHWNQDLANRDRARALAEQLADQPRLSRALYWLGRVHYTTGKLDTSIDYAQDALGLAEELRDETLLAPPVNLLGRVHFLLGENERAAELLARSAEQMSSLGNRIEEATAAGMLSLCEAQLGRFPQAVEAAEHSMRIAEEIQHLPTLAACLGYRAQVQTHRGNWRPALADFRRGLELAEKGGDVFRTYLLRGNLGWAYVVAGDYARAEAELTRALEIAERLGTRFVVGLYLSLLAEARLGMGQVRDALHLSREALRLAIEINQRWAQSRAYLALAQALLRNDPQDYRSAEEAVQQAIAIQQDFGLKCELPRSLLVHASMLRAKGEVEKAKEKTARAVGMLHEMGMAWDLERAEQALRELENTA